MAAGTFSARIRAPAPPRLPVASVVLATWMLMISSARTIAIVYYYGYQHTYY